MTEPAQPPEGTITLEETRELPPARSLEQRIRDTIARLETEVDAWVATADPATGEACLVPLSYVWDGRTLLMATPTASVTGRNLAASGTVRLGIGPTRDVVLIEGAVEATPGAELPPEVGDDFAVRMDWDPRLEPNPYSFYRVTPRRIQAWREVNELPARTILRDGTWLG